MVLAGAVYVVTLVAAGVSAWGWAGMVRLEAGGAVDGVRVIALVAGQFGAIGGVVATTFALPRRWRAGAGAGWLIAGGLLTGLAEAAAVGMAVAGAPTVAAGFAVAGVGFALLAWWRTRKRRALDELHQHIRRTGQVADGVVTEVGSHSRINGVPRWRIVVSYADAAGTRRWVTKHATTYSPPRTGRPVVVRYDPARPGDQRRIVVDW